MSCESNTQSFDKLFLYNNKIMISSLYNLKQILPSVFNLLTNMFNEIDRMRMIKLNLLPTLFLVLLQSTMSDVPQIINVLYTHAHAHAHAHANTQHTHTTHTHTTHTHHTHTHKTQKHHTHINMLTNTHTHTTHTHTHT